MDRASFEETPGIARRFARTFVLLCAAQGWVLARTGPALAWTAYAAVVTACFAATFVPRLFRSAIVVTLACVAGLAAWRFPYTANHLYLQAVTGVVLAVTTLDDDDETRTLLAALRTMAIGVFFWSGVQKILHGAYFDGSFLCWNLVRGTHDAWRSVARIVLPAEELGNVARAQTTGACRFVTPLGVALSNAVYVSELACAAVLLHPRARTRGALGVAAVLVAIEIAMSEWVFAAFFANLLLLFAAPRWSARATPVFAAWAVLVALLSGRP